MSSVANGNDISTLLDVQKNYITSLNVNSAAPDEIAIKLNTLNDNLAGLSSSLANNSTAYILTGQNTVSDIVSREKDRLSKKEHSIELAESGKNRVIQLNTNYKKRIEAYNSIIFSLIISIILYIGLLVLKQMKVIPDVIMTTLFIVLIAAAIIYCVKKYITIVFRDSIYFDELNGDSIFFKTPESILKDISNGSLVAGTSNGISITGLDIDTDFCPTASSYCSTGTVWDSTESKCVVDTDSFVSTTTDVNSKLITPFSLSEYSSYSKNK
jgi:hypothetical protein